MKLLVLKDHRFNDGEIIFKEGEIVEGRLSGTGITLVDSNGNSDGMIGMIWEKIEKNFKEIDEKSI